MENNGGGKTVINNVTFLGTIVSELKFEDETWTKDKSCEFTILQTDDYKNKEGNYEETTIPVVAFGYHADFVRKFFRKGDPIVIMGRLRTWELDNRLDFDIVCKSVNFVGSKNKKRIY